MRQTAAFDADEHTRSGKPGGLSEYYTERGESPGMWTGRGIAGLGMSGQVTESQMRLLFGEGRHPDTQAALGRPFYVYEASTDYRDRCKDAYQAYNTVRGLEKSAPIDDPERDRIRTDVAAAMFRETHNRAPVSGAEFTGWVARISRPTSMSVAGYDLTFSPVKSVSALWALADSDLAGQVRAAHEKAVASTLDWLERECAFTRTGANGVAQVPIRGLVIAEFTHRDARSGEPDLHTHAAVSNKVQALDGRWLALDGRTMHKYTVAASEHYNTALEAEITTRIGARFTPVERADGKRQVRELVGVAPELIERWSSRRQAIARVTGQLAAQFTREHGRVPTAVETVRLAQQANLSTRAGKHEPRSEHDQRAVWATEAQQLLGPNAARRTVAAVHAAGRQPGGSERWAPVTADLEHDLTQSVLAVVQGERATWQHPHLLAEARRQVRAAGIHPTMSERLAQAATSRAIAACMPIGADLAPPAAVTPAALRHPSRDGERAGRSVFTQAGGQLFTSTAIIAAEQRLVAAAGRFDGGAATALDVDLAHAEWSANHGGRTLNTGQLALIEEMATSGARVQLALAPAGTGKSTAMGVLAAAWRNAGGTVVGLAPQASAAEELATALGHGSAGATDTLDKLVWELTHRAPQHRPDWVTSMDARTLLIIDEAGLASTPNLDVAVRYALARGGSVRLIGDDRQQAARGAGGVLRDIAATHGSVELAEVLRFADENEKTASLALRAGDPLALGFYLDHHRLHVAAPDAVIDTVYRAWSADISAGRQSLMTAPTLDQVTQLNARARGDRLDAVLAAGGRVGREIVTGAGETLSAGDLIFTKANDRRLSVGGTDYVKNNDRWVITTVGEDGSLDVTHATRTGITTRLPAGYVDTHVRLGYAATDRSVQGSTVGQLGRVQGTCHNLIAPTADRNTFYTDMTRGTDANHAYFTVGGTGDFHELVRPDAVSPPTVADLALAVLGRDASARSVATEQRDASDPYRQLGHNADAYAHSIDTLAVAALGPDRLAALVAAAQRSVPGITAAPAWDTLCGHLAILTLDRRDAIGMLTAAAGRRELDTALDVAAVLDWRLDKSGTHSQRPGPLPWLPAIPATLAGDPTAGPYLRDWQQRVTTLLARLDEQARGWTPATAPAWAQPYLDNPDLLEDLARWRAARSVPDVDLDPAGAYRPPAVALRRRRDDLTDRAARHCGDARDGHHRWQQHLAALGVTVGGDADPTVDPMWPVVAARLTLADNAGLPVTRLLADALNQGAVPAEHPASVLWSRLHQHLGDPNLAATDSTAVGIRPPWSAALTDALGPEIAERILTDRAWPVAVAHIDTAARAGADPARLLTAAATMLDPTTVPAHHQATVLLWHLALLTDPLADADDTEPAFPDPTDEQQPPADADTVLEQLDTTEPHGSVTTGLDLADLAPTNLDKPPADGEPPVEPDATPPPGYDDAVYDLRVADPGAVPTAADAAAAPAPDDAATAQIRARIAELNAAAAAFYTDHYPHSWARAYLTGRLGVDSATLPGVTVGYAPAGWTTLVDHLRQSGAADSELLAAGLAKTTTDGRVIDRFRDRVMFPITGHDDNGEIEVRGFIGRRNPQLDEARDVEVTGRYLNPKYLNTPDTALFRKGRELYGLAENADQLAAGATPVLVEGPIDALAITISGGIGLGDDTSTRERFVGVAPLGTAFTAEQAVALHRHTRAEVTPVIATDADLAGHRAAARAFWQLANRGEPPRHLALPAGADPASYLTDAGPDQLHAALTVAAPLADTLIERRVDWYADRLDTVEGTLAAVRAAAAVIAALPPEQWPAQVDRLTDRAGAHRGTIITEVAERATTYSTNPDSYTAGQTTIDTDPRLARRLAPPAPTGPEPTAEAPATPAETDTVGVPYVTVAALAEQLEAAEASVARITSRSADDEPMPDRPSWDQPDEPGWQYPDPDPTQDDWDDDRTR